ncbi:MAG: aminopeptidase [Alphaproteobacteria bacterium]|nr:aminopeptidase [Alphaproteobacteria bacterium]|tara:strand:- start:2511 stop:3479 length:969 start_codon:yes stop_codon:yes gene_type:complete
MFEIIRAGLETSVQDFPGRWGHWEQGFPPSGPFDMWSFRLANLLVGNSPQAAGLECQFSGPQIRFHTNMTIALTGGVFNAHLDGEPMPQWQSIDVKAGQELFTGFAQKGARGYLAFTGGIDAPVVLGSRSTFHLAGIGGINGHALKDGMKISTLEGKQISKRRVLEKFQPEFPKNNIWNIEVVLGPNDSWINEDGHKTFLNSDWTLQTRSNRTGYRLTGPEITFSEKARNKGPEHGEHPSNILDHGYPVGSVNLCGQTPIILVNDGPSAGGFINPWTVPSAAFWKLAQSRPNDTFRFSAINVDEAQNLRKKIDTICTEQSIC